VLFDINDKIENNLSVSQKLLNEPFYVKILSKMLAVNLNIQISNFLNSKNDMKCSKGFILDSINNIFDFKMNDQDKTLIFYLVEETEK